MPITYVCFAEEIAGAMIPRVNLRSKLLNIRNSDTQKYWMKNTKIYKT
jgi:hypothetical protein